MCKCISNKCKKIFAVFLYLLSLVIGLIGAYLYLVPFAAINNNVKDGGSYIPKFRYSFSRFTDWIAYSSYACVGAGFLGLITAKCKSPFIGVPYFLAAVGAGLLCLYSAKMAIDFNEDIRDTVCTFKGDEINNQYNELVNKWMCTTDCYCYEG